MCIRDRRLRDAARAPDADKRLAIEVVDPEYVEVLTKHYACLLYTSDAADERSSVDLGGRRIIKKKHNDKDT